MDGWQDENEILSETVDEDWSYTLEYEGMV